MNDVIAIVVLLYSVAVVWALTLCLATSKEEPTPEQDISRASKSAHVSTRPSAMRNSRGESAEIGGQMSEVM
jgi:hypothetical protein